MTPMPLCPHGLHSTRRKQRLQWSSIVTVGKRARVEDSCKQEPNGQPQYVTHPLMGMWSSGPTRAKLFLRVSRLMITGSAIVSLSAPFQVQPLVAGLLVLLEVAHGER